MAFTELNKDVLELVAQEFSVEWTKENPTKPEMIKDLKDEGVTWAMYKEAFPDVKDQEETEDKPDDQQEEVKENKDAASEFKTKKEKVLVKMTRGNGTFQIRGYTFTKSHPFLPVDPDDADYLVSNQEGFSIATPREVEEFYS